MPLSGKTILHINPALHAGGAEVSVLNNSAAIVKAGGKAIVVSGPGRMVAQLETSGASWIPFPADTKNPVIIAKNVARLISLARDMKVDLIHAHSRAPAWSAYRASQVLKIPFVTSYHGIYGSGHALKRWYNSVMARGDIVIANSRYTAKHIEQQYPASRTRIEIIYPGIDLDLFNPAHVSRTRVDAVAGTIILNPDARIVLLPGRITAIKGQNLLIQAASIIKTRAKQPVQFVMMGEAGNKWKQLAALKRLISSLGLEDTCLLTSHHSDMPAALAMADIVVMPTLRPEGFGRTVAEAAAMERPVIASDLGAPKETILAPPDFGADQLTGWHFSHANVQALADTISHALSLESSECVEIGKRGRRHIRENFSLSASNEAIIDMYTRLLKVNN